VKKILWPQVPLGNHVDLLCGFPFKSGAFTDNPNDIPLVKGANVHQGFIDWGDAKFWPRHEVGPFDRYWLRSGDVVLAMDRPWIEAGLKYAWITPRSPKSLLVQRVARMRGTNGLESEYLRHLIGSPTFTDYIRPIVTGINVPHISADQIKAFRFPLPPKATQRKIAGVLSAYDDLIENNTRRIAILEEMAQAIYREWFVHFRFPGHESARFTDFPLGKIPEGWKVVPLSEKLVVLETGSRPKGGVGEITEGVPSIGAENVRGAGQYVFAATRYVPLSFYEQMRQGILCDRDVLVYKDGGKPGYFIPHISFVGSGFPFREMVINSHVYRLRASHPIAQEFLYYHLSSDAMLEWMHLHGSGAAIPSIARKDLQRLPLLVPADRIVSEFSTFAEKSLSQILVLARKAQNLRTTRDLLLPKLISGQLDVEDLDIDAGELPTETLA
jgi:type I restriction enzyme, S subunit